MFEVLAFFSGFFVVFLKGLQSKNIVGGHYLPTFLTSYPIALSEAGVVLAFVNEGLYAAVFVGTGGGLGGMLAIWSHGHIIDALNRLIRKRHV